MDPKLQSELSEFQQKKEDVFQNIHLLNKLSESLVHSIAEEEKKMADKKNKELIESKKKKTASELELLGLENSKMESYLDILAKKQELEVKYLEQMCDQHARIHKLGDKFSYLDFSGFLPYEVHYKHELGTVKREHQPQDGSRTRKPRPFQQGFPYGSSPHNDHYARHDDYSPHQSPPPPNHSQTPPPPPVPSPDTNIAMNTLQQTSPIPQRAESVPPPNPEPPPPPPQPQPQPQQQPPTPHRRQTIAVKDPEPIKPPPQRRLSLQDQLQFALTNKFSKAIGDQDDGPSEPHDSDSDGFD